MNDLTKGNEAKGIFFFAMPMLIGSLFQQLYNTADSIIVGRFVGVEAMAAVSGANPIMFLLTSLLMGITLGFSILVSQYFGSKKMDKVKSTIDTTYIFVFIASIVITFLGIALTTPILKLMNTPDNIFNLSKGYLNIIFAGTIFSAGYNSISAILRGLGDSKNPLIFLIISTVLNIILDIVFIIYFDMGINGVALATIIAQGVSFIFSIIYLNKKHNVLKFDIKNLSFNKNIFIRGLRLGVPSGIQQMLFSVGTVTLQSLVNGYGTSAMAAFGAGAKIESFISLPIINLGAALSTFVAQNIGAKKAERIKKGLHASLIMSTVLAISVAFLFLFFSEELVRLFNTDEEVVKIGSEYLRTIGPFFIAVCTSYMQSSVIKGAGDSMFALISSMISLWLVRIPAAYVFSNMFGTVGLWYGIVFGWAVGLVITHIYYVRGSWQRKADLLN